PQGRAAPAARRQAGPQDHRAAPARAAARGAAGHPGVAALRHRPAAEPPRARADGRGAARRGHRPEAARAAAARSVPRRHAGQVLQKHVARLETRPSNIEGKGETLARDLVRNSLRMRPDRIIVGEVRGGEVLDMLQAMNTGHEGSMTTIHANNPRDAMSRMEAMAGLSGVAMPEALVRQTISRALNIAAQSTRAT